MADVLAAVRLLLEDLSQPLARALGLSKLSEQAPLIVACAVLFWVIHVVVAPTLSWAIFPGTYGRLKTQRDRNNWNIRIVSLVHALVVIPFSIKTLNLPALDEDRAFGWDSRGGTLASIACGYFLWDTIESLVHFYDIGFVVHGLSCFFIYFLSFKPFIVYYGPRFLLWELSTPFLNIHWFLDKMGLTGSTLQLINGLFLLSSFAGARLVYGSLQSYAFYHTLFSIKDEVPLAVVFLYGIGNIVLTSLNLLWFSKMVAALRKRMRSPGKAGKIINGKRIDKS